MPVFGLSMGTLPVIGFNFGAKIKTRIKDAIKFSTIAAVIFMSICLVIFQTLPRQILSLFNASTELYAIGIPAFRTISTIFPFIVISIIFATVFQGLSKAYISLVIGLFRQFVSLIPTALILASFMKVNLVWLDFPITEVFGLLITIVVFIRIFNKSVSDWEALSEISEEIGT